MNNSKMISVLLLASITLISMSGCSELQDTVTRNNRTSIEFSWWGNDDRHQYTMDGVENFESNNSDIVVKNRYGEWAGYETKNRVWMNSNTEADVMQINYAWLEIYSDDGEGYYDLNELRDYLDLSGYDESDLKYGMKNGKLNAIPIAFNTSTVCHNATAYEAYGLEYPTTWDELFEVAKAVKDDGKYAIGMSKKHLFLLLLAYFEQTTGKRAYNEDGTLNASAEDVGYILDFYKELLDTHALMPLEEFGRGRFADGTCLSSLFWISDADNYCSALAEKGDVPVIGSFFKEPGAKLSGLYMKPATMYAIANITDSPVESARLLNYLINDSEMAILQGTEKGVPINRNAVNALIDNDSIAGYGYEAYQQMQLAKDDMNIMIPVMENEAIIDALKNGASAYLYDVQTREETVNQIYESMQAGDK